LDLNSRCVTATVADDMMSLDETSTGGGGRMRHC
jgi:hypothetical protein